MELEMLQPYIVLVKTDDQGRIVAIDSSDFLSDSTGWTRIDEGYDDRYHHAQRNYLPTPLIEDGVYRYKLVDGRPVQRSRAELEADREAVTSAPSSTSDNERFESLEQQIQMLLEGVTVDGKES